MHGAWLIRALIGLAGVVVVASTASVVLPDPSPPTSTQEVASSTPTAFATEFSSLPPTPTPSVRPDLSPSASPQPIGTPEFELPRLIATPALVLPTLAPIPTPPPSTPAPTPEPSPCIQAIPVPTHVPVLICDVNQLIKICC